jgi:general secretion pathway protein D
VQAVKSDTRFDVLSTPRIFTSNNATAEINISQSLPYVTSTSVDTTTGAQFYNYSFLDVGIILTVTPRITGNGYVTMDVDQTANDFVNYTSFNAPVVNQREAQTTVSVKDGETIVLGGIIQSQNTRTVNKIPLLGDLPLLGQFFRSHSSEKIKTELLIFLTPHIIRDAEAARKLREQTEKSMQPSTQQTLKEFRQLDTTVNPNVPDVSGKVDGTTKGVTPAPQNTTPGQPTPAPQTKPANKPPQ